MTSRHGSWNSKDEPSRVDDLTGDVQQLVDEKINFTLTLTSVDDAMGYPLDERKYQRSSDEENS